MLANFVIGLREGLEASLVVGILLAYLARTGRREAMRPLWIGVLAAVVLSGVFGGILTVVTDLLGERGGEIFEGVVGLIAVCFVTYMVFWMKRASRHMKAELEGRLTTALRVGAWAIGLTAFVAVAREGLELATFMWTNITTNTGSGPVALTGAVLGVAAAVLLEYLLYRRAVRLNLSKFFLVTGVLLVVVAAGVFSGAIHELQEAAILPGEHSLAFDVSGAVPESSWYGSVLKGIVGFRAETSWLMAVGWACYLVPVLTLFLRRGSRSSGPSRTMQPAGAGRASS
ncbi:MAG TPA: iron uptake transporter permease EfeU [Nocardioidaceae bacterium]|nr:iron uptake transporter permease EfeU [Nocardioidaceae bacterium]